MLYPPPPGPPQQQTQTQQTDPQKLDKPPPKPEKPRQTGARVQVLYIPGQDEKVNTHGGMGDRGYTDYYEKKEWQEYFQVNLLNDADFNPLFVGWEKKNV